MAAAVADRGFSASLTDREHTRIEESRPADVPSDEEMEAAGAVIGDRGGDDPPPWELPMRIAGLLT